MLKKISILAAALGIAGTVTAAPLTPEQAYARLRSDAVSQSRLRSSGQMKLAYTAELKAGVPAAYVFVNQNSEGFAVLSADDRAVALLGYSDSGSFDADNLPPSFKWWMSEYGRRIDAAGGSNVADGAGAVYAPAQWSAIAPLLTTKWNQDAPYNLMAPMVKNVQAPTGCVATSFAQVMNYFEYPEKGTGFIRYTNDGKTLILNLEKTAFDWGNMLDEYTGNGYTQEQADAVAYLMKACGYSVEMNYGTLMSGAQSYKIADAAINYFNYDAGTRYIDRNYYSYDEWSTMIYENIKNVGPVIYNGSSIEGGHSFVCDGYDGNGYFHFNWGWGGMSDGYYVLDSLNPESQGIGGAAGGFNYSQDVVLGMQKPTGQPAEIRYATLNVYGTVEASLNGNKISFKATDSSIAGWGNPMYRPINVEVGAILSNIDGTGDDIVSKGTMSDNSPSISLGISNYMPTDRLYPVIPVPGGLKDGKYKVTLACKDLEYEDSPWTPFYVFHGMANYCYLTVEGGKASVTSASPKSLSFEDVEFGSPLYYGRNALLKADVVNNSDIQLTECFFPALYRNGVMMFQGDMMLVTVDAGKTEHNEWLVRFLDAPANNGVITGSFDLCIVDRESGKIIGKYGSYDMQSTSSGFTLKLNDFCIENAAQENVVVGKREFKNVYIVNDASDFDIILKYKVQTGYFDTSMRVVYGEYKPDINKFEVAEDNLYYATPFLGSGDSADLVIPVDFSDKNQTTVYQLRAAYMQGATNKTLGTIYVGFPTSAVEEIEVDTNATCEYFNLQGVKVDNPAKGELLIKKSGAKTEKIIF